MSVFCMLVVTWGKLEDNIARKSQFSIWMRILPISLPNCSQTEFEYDISCWLAFLTKKYFIFTLQNFIGIINISETKCRLLFYSIYADFIFLFTKCQFKLWIHQLPYSILNNFKKKFLVKCIYFDVKNEFYLNLSAIFYCLKDLNEFYFFYFFKIFWGYVVKLEFYKESFKTTSCKMMKSYVCFTLFLKNNEKCMH